MLSVLRARDFRLLWLGQSASTVGDALVLVAVGLFVTRLTGRPSDVGLVLAAYSVPLVLLLLVGGVVADRLPRQLVMLVSDAVRAVLHGVLALLILTGAVRVWHMVLVGALFGSAEAFFRPAYSGLVPQTVPEEQVQQAQALSGVSREVAQIAGPALATVLVLGVGGAAAFGLDALTFVLSALLLSRLRTRDRGEPSTGGGMVRELRDGWDAVRSRPWVWATIGGFSGALLVALAPWYVLGPTVSRHVYGTEAVFGLANAAWGVGTVSGAVLATRWRPARPLLVGVGGSVPWAAAISLFALGPPRAVAYAGLAVAGVGVGVFAVLWETALAQRVPPHLLSRVSAWDWMGSLALLPLGFALAGPVASLVGGTTVLVVGGLLGSALTALALLPASTRTLARLDVEAAAVS